MTVTPEMIAAYADGELAGEERQRVEAAIAADPELARQVERHRRLRAMLSARYAPITAAPVPERMTDLVASAAKTGTASAQVLSLAQARARRGLAPTVRRWLPVAGPAIAASLVLALWQPWQRAERPGYAPAEPARQPPGVRTARRRAAARAAELCRTRRPNLPGVARLWPGRHRLPRFGGLEDRTETAAGEHRRSRIPPGRQRHRSPRRRAGHGSGRSTRRGRGTPREDRGMDPTARPSALVREQLRRRQQHRAGHDAHSHNGLAHLVSVPFFRLPIQKKHEASRFIQQKGAESG
jgi:hypothetical protein